MKKGLVNAYLALNLGDDLFLKILFDRYPNVQWIINTRDDRYNRVFQKYKNVKIRENLYTKIIRKFNNNKLSSIELKKYDFGITIGGSMFMESKYWRKGVAELRKEVMNFASQSKPYFILGSNFGPFHSEEFYEEHKKIFKSCEDVCFREKFSYDLFSDVNGVRFYPDIVFGIKVDQVEKKEKSIGVSIIDISEREGLDIYEERYIDLIRAVTEKAIEQGYNITFFSFCEEQGDLIAINKVVKDIDNKYLEFINVVNYDGDIKKFINKFQSMENIIGSRFHACILSQVFKQGLYPIVYSDKTTNVLKEIDLDKEYIYIKQVSEIDSEHILKVISRNKVNVKNIVNESKKQFEVLDSNA